MLCGCYGTHDYGTHDYETHDYGTHDYGTHDSGTQGGVDTNNMVVASKMCMNIIMHQCILNKWCYTYLWETHRKSSHIILFNCALSYANEHMCVIKLTTHY